MGKEPHTQDQSRNCWKRIGVSGDRTCPELAKLVHCHNCPKYSEAGARMLDRDPPPGYLEMWTAMLAQEKEVEVPGTISVVIFRVREEWLALPTEVFEEATEVRRIHSIPGKDGAGVLLGLANVRGELQLCISIASLLGVDEPDGAQEGGRRQVYPRMVVVSRRGERWVFPVDELHGVHRLHPGELENVPVTVANGKESYTRGVFNWQDKSVGCLDDELVFNSLGRSVS